MKTLLLSFAFFVIVSGVFVLKNNQENAAQTNFYKQETIPFCGQQPSGNPGKSENGKFIMPLPGSGQYSYKISTTNDSAQFYFNQGLTMYYSYHMKEALASFMEASRFDPRHPMPYWGQALAMGPYYNAAHSYLLPAAIPEIVTKMNETATYGNDDENTLIKTMTLRYSNDISDANRKNLNIAYADAMKKLVTSHTSNVDVKALYVDAVMLIHAWDFWNADGSAKPWTQELVSLCETILKENPNHPAALHYHIHLTEASRHPETALPNADKLKNLLPGVAHMVHMSSHEYQRNGMYAKGVEVNDLADGNLLHYDSLAPYLQLNKRSTHYYAVQTYCALSGGMYQTGMRDALRCRKSVAPTAQQTYDQYMFMMPVLTLVRLGKWNEILKDSIMPDPKWSYASLLSNFAKGLAYVNTGEVTAAKKQLELLHQNSKDPILTKVRIPFNAPVSMASIAGKILHASILFSEKKYDEAFSDLNKAIKIEDNLVYTEPTDWPIPARQFLGAFLLKTGKSALAEKVYREDLELNPGNGWSLIGLSKSLKAQRKNDQLATYKTKYMRAFSGSENIPSSSVYMK
ncbi:hypothetical protein [Dyadobacter frigoris]|uniref:Tetratricopeptide repeat protein n=1 Tax=Dyadobacter frigoris TaxID=2576211 RepID=A0A4U6CU16_9BACT|nr:hypothetical protein [Dyadobacter frigoris]TKT88092.1 hypothetical protein FDK13_27340 [Dyadobacter frigoris]GLU53703.1 hypothetical protein Dfri01_31640 [Dyadobacter frigoris]